MCNDMIVEILEKVPIENGTPIFSEEIRNLIHEVAEQGRNASFFRDNNTQTKACAYARELTAEEVYLDMLGKVAYAPTMLHARASAIGLLMIIDEKLQEKSSYQEAI